jgi:Ca2+-binding RTX toxin-like protein
MKFLKGLLGAAKQAVANVKQAVANVVETVSSVVEAVAGLVGIVTTKVAAASGKEVIIGTPGDDKLVGGEGKNVIIGGPGNDKIVGGPGNDILIGGPGDDKIVGGAGNDILIGGPGDDTLIGGEGNDRIVGGAGNDTLIGGPGGDKLTGGSGENVFVYENPEDSTLEDWDRITDFTQGSDTLDLSALLGEDQDLAWGDQTPTAHGVWHESEDSSTIVYVDTTGDAEADMKIELKNTEGLVLTVEDFVGVSEVDEPVDPTPIARGDHVITNFQEFDAFAIPEWALLANDTSPVGRQLSIVGIDDVQTSLAGSITFAPGNGSDGVVDVQFGFDPVFGSFTYVVTDGSDDTEDSAPAAVTITQQGDPFDDTGNTLEGTDGDDILIAYDGFGARLFGNGGNDVLIGTPSGDILNGGPGDDLLFGGGGPDIFQFAFAAEGGVTSDDGFDTILDFSWGEDKLEFMGLAGFTAEDFQAAFNLDEGDFGGGAGADTRLALIDDSWSVTLREVSGRTLDDFYSDSIFS